MDVSPTLKYFRDQISRMCAVAPTSARSYVNKVKILNPLVNKSLITQLTTTPAASNALSRLFRGKTEEKMVAFPSGTNWKKIKGRIVRIKRAT